MDFIALTIFILVLILNFAGVFFLVILREKNQRQKQKLHFSFEMKEFRIFRELREIFGFLCFALVFLGGISLFFNKEYLYGVVVTFVFIATIILSAAYTVNKI